MKNKKYINSEIFENLYKELDKMAMMIHGLIKK
jgi:hypothetical protein